MYYSFISFLDVIDEQVIINAFKEYKSKAEHLQSMYVSDYTLNNALTDAKHLLTIFEGFRNQYKDDALLKTKQSYQDSVKSFKNFINKYGKNLNKLFKSKRIPEVFIIT